MAEGEWAELEWVAGGWAEGEGVWAEGVGRGRPEERTHMGICFHSSGFHAIFFASLSFSNKPGAVQSVKLRQECICF